jgi:hypothetical protein
MATSVFQSSFLSVAIKLTVSVQCGIFHCHKKTESASEGLFANFQNHKFPCHVNLCL